MRINNNMAALNAWRSLTVNGANMTKSLEKLSSGFRINKAGDDAAGLAVSEKMRAQIRGMNMAVRNAQDGVSLVQTAEGGASKIGDMLQRMRELAVQANSEGIQNSDRQLLHKEFAELVSEIDRTADIKFNGQKLLDGSVFGAGNELSIQVGANAGEKIDLTFTSLKKADLQATNITDLAGATVATKTVGALDISTQDGAHQAIQTIDQALNTVNTARASMGAFQNRLENAISTLQTQVENITAAESRIRDVDMAAEMAQFTKHNILQQASTSMLAQANQSTQGVLSLLR